jgi:hypothetical protein
MARGYKSGLMDLNMKDNGIKERSMDMGFYITVMEMCMMVNSKKILLVGKGNSLKAMMETVSLK